MLATRGASQPRVLGVGVGGVGGTRVGALVLNFLIAMYPRKQTPSQWPPVYLRERITRQFKENK